MSKKRKFGLSLYKSIKMGPVRLNLSSSGIGASAGVGGVRLRTQPGGIVGFHNNTGKNKTDPVMQIEAPITRAERNLANLRTLSYPKLHALLATDEPELPKPAKGLVVSGILLLFLSFFFLIANSSLGGIVLFGFIGIVLLIWGSRRNAANKKNILESYKKAINDLRQLTADDIAAAQTVDAGGTGNFSTPENSAFAGNIILNKGENIRMVMTGCLRGKQIDGGFKKSDSGDLALTDQRLIYISEGQHNTFDLKSVTTVKVIEDGFLLLTVKGKQTVNCFYLPGYAHRAAATIRTIASN